MTSAAKHTAGPAFVDGKICNIDGHRLWSGAVRPVSKKLRGDIAFIQSAAHIGGISNDETKANADLIAEAFTVAHETGLTPRQLAEQRNGLLEALKRIRLWLAEEGCNEPLGLADSALRAGGVSEVTCPRCQGDGEWDEGALPATSSAQIDPEYRRVKCLDCDATGRVSIAGAEGGVS